MIRREDLSSSGLLVAALLSSTAPPVCTQVGAMPGEVTAKSKADLEACERFSMLRSTRKSMLVARVRGRLVQSGFPAFARIRNLAFDSYESPEAESAPIFDAESRIRIESDATEHSEVTDRFARTRLLNDLHVHVFYDWRSGAVVQNEVPPGYEAVFTNLLNGYPPGTDQALAKVIEGLDRDQAIRKSADWFGHAYADLERRAFLGATLYDAWYSGKPVDVPDIDAIAFAQDVLGTDQYQAPLSGRPRTRLYKAIGKSALTYRKHRTMREAAAAAFVHDDPPMDEIYGRLVPRFHYLFAKHDDSLAKVCGVLGDMSRDELIREIDDRIADQSSDAWKISEQRRAEIRAMRAATRAYALAELEVFAGPPQGRD